MAMLMQTRTLKLVSYIYLLLVPIFTAGLGFGVGHVSYKLYLPLWLINVLFMTMSSWFLGLNVIRLKNEGDSNLAKTSFLIIAPWVLISMFAGLGPPPDTATEWTATIKEQQARYFMLVVSGVLFAFGFGSLRGILRREGENFYSPLALSAVSIAIPLFIINMLYWGFYLGELFKIQTTANASNLPDWYFPTRQLFGFISVVEVALTYLATFLIVLAIRKVGWLSNTSSSFYILLSLLAFAIIILSVFFTESFKTAAFVVSIPAFPFLMPYFISINLLRQAGDQRNEKVDIK